MFTWAGDLNGYKEPVIRKKYIADATALKKGVPVDYTIGTGIIAHASYEDMDDPIAGVTMSEKVANDGFLNVEISASPTAFYRYTAAKVYTLTGGSTTTAVDSSLLPQTNSFWKGGAIEIVTCAADASLVGKIVKLSDSTGATGTLTLAETLPVALAAGDTVKIVPGPLAEGHFGWDLTADGLHPDFDTDGGECLKFLYSDVNSMTSFYAFRLHKDANSNLAL